MASPAKAAILERKRQVDLEKLSDDQADLLAQQIGLKIAKEFSDVTEKCRKLLKIYGLDIKLTYLIHKQGEDPLLDMPAAQSILEEAKAQSIAAAEPPKKKRGRPRKTNPSK